MNADQASVSFLVRDCWASDSMENVNGIGVRPIFEDGICWEFAQCLEYKTEYKTLYKHIHSVAVLGLRAFCVYCPNTQEGLCCWKHKLTGQIKYRGMQLKNSCADLQLNNICAMKRQNPGVFPSEDFHSFLTSTKSSFIGVFHLEASPNAL